MSRIAKLERRVETNSHLLHLTEEMANLKTQEKHNFQLLEEAKFNELDKRIHNLEQKLMDKEEYDVAIKKLENDHYRLLELTQELTDTLKTLPMIQEEVELM